MPILLPGVYDPSEAPWWEFSCQEFPTVRKQWMSEAARHFAHLLANRMAGGKPTVTVLWTSLDGITGTYEVKLRHHRVAQVIVVTREYQVPQPESLPK